MRDNPDRNAAELYENLSKSGWAVVRIATAVQRKSGVPDAIVARKGSRLNHFLEVKALGGRLSAEQLEFARTWPSGCWHCATNSFEADLLLKDCEGRRG